VQLLDAYTNDFAYIDRGANHGRASATVLLPPHWTGPVPAGLRVVRSPTQTVWLLGRTLVSGQADMPAARRVLEGYALTPLAAWPAGTRNHAVVLGSFPRQPPVALPRGLTFFDELGSVLAEDPQPARDACAMRAFERAGIGLRSPASRVHEPVRRRALVVAAAVGSSLIDAAVERERRVNEHQHHGWLIAAADVGRFGTDYARRAMIARTGLASNTRGQAMYSTAVRDALGRPFSGDRRYTVTFGSGELPPVFAFWSLTLYTSGLQLWANPLDRYSIGDRTPRLRYGADGSLTIFIQHNPPRDRSNWLPAPRGPFALWLRLYKPRPAAADLRWQPPPVVAGGARTRTAAAASATGWPRCISRHQRVRVGIREVARSRHGRLLTLTLRSRAMRGLQHVDVLLPRGFDARRAKRYRVLYLLHGAGGDYRSWVEIGVQKLLGDLPVIAVMPSGSQPAMDGNYTDWAFTAPAGPQPPPAWESYHIRELVPFIDHHFPTIATAAGRAIAGISMGGGGATKYAAEYPGTFGYVGTFSGESHPLLPAALAFQPKSCRWSDPAIHQVIWRDNDSTDLAGNLRGVRVFVRTGTGAPGPFDSPTPPADPGAAVIRQARLIVELGAHLENEAFVQALRRAGVSGVNAQFFPGSHSLPYWQRDTRQFVAWLRDQFRRPPTAPAAVVVKSAHTLFTAWGWSVHVLRRAREFLYMRLTRHRVSATGSGRVRVQTPPWFAAHTAHRITSSGRILRVRAGRDGRLSFSLDLGPSHTRDQTQFGPTVTRHWTTTAASID
jgi:S-formylglutathione hydrolase FrmB